MIIASDLDGVIAYTPYKKDDFVPSRLREFYRSCKPTKYSIFNYDFIITGRKDYYRKITENWLKENNVNYNKLIMYPTGLRKSLEGVFKYKAEIINKLNVNKYYENHKGIYNYLKRNCRNTDIVFVDDLG
jgi:uncharacterized HAD superfamily protein